MKVQYPQCMGFILKEVSGLRCGIQIFIKQGGLEFSKT